MRNALKDKDHSTGIKIRLIMLWLAFDFSSRQLYFKVFNNASKESRGLPRGVLFKLRMAFVFFRRMLKNNLFLAELVREKLKLLASEGTQEVAFYGETDLLRFALPLAEEFSLKIKGIYGKGHSEGGFYGRPVFSNSLLAKYGGKVAICGLTNIRQETAQLLNLGISESNIIKFN